MKSIRRSTVAGVIVAVALAAPPALLAQPDGHAGRFERLGNAVATGGEITIGSWLAWLWDRLVTTTSQDNGTINP